MSLKDELKEYYTVEELASLLRVTRAVIEKWEQGGELAGEVFEAVTRYPRREVEKLLGKQRRAKWVKMRRAGVAVLGILAAIAGAVAAKKLRNRDDD